MTDKIKEFVSARRQAGDNDDDIKNFLKAKGITPRDEYFGGKKSLGSKILGFGKEVVKSVAKPVAEMGVSAVNAARNVGSLAKGPNQSGKYNDYSKKSYNLPLLGQTKPAFKGGEDTGQFAKKVVGYGLDIGSNVVGGSGAVGIGKATLKGAIKQGVKTGVKTGFVSGAMYGAGSTLQKEAERKTTDLRSYLNSAGKAIGAGIGTGAVNAVAGGALGVVGPVAGKTIKTVAMPGKALIGAGKSTIEAGEAILKRVVRPVDADYKKGLDIKNFKKYNIYGDLGDMLSATQARLKTTMNGIKSLAKKEGDVPVATGGEIIRELESKFSGEGYKSLGQRTRITSELERIKKEFGLINPDWENKILNFTEVLDSKRASGLEALFNHDPLKKVASSEEEVWNALYGIFKEKLEKNAPALWGKLNKEASELIPIENALVRRARVADRNNIMSLPDIIGYAAAVSNPKALAVVGASKALKSGKVAGGLIQAGKALERTGEKFKFAKPFALKGLSIDDVSKNANPSMGKIENTIKDKANTVFKLMGNELKDVSIIGSTARGKINPRDLDILITPKNKLPVLKSIPKNSSESFYARQDLAKVFEDELRPLFPDKKIHITIAEYDSTRGPQIGLSDYFSKNSNSKIDPKNFKSAEEYVKAHQLVYHGTQKKLKRFNNKQGTYFTDDYMNADGYANGENVYEGYLNLKKPFVVDAGGRKWDDLNTKYGKSTQQIVGNVDSKKYDGVIIKNVKDNWIDDVDYQDPITIYYAFKPRDAFLNKSQLIEEWKKANKKN